MSAGRSRSLGVNYPVAIDNSYLTWENYGNQQWPSEYLIDQTGQLRYIEAGEGDYGQTETLIRDLLSAYGRPATRPHRRPRPDPEGDHHPRDVPRYFRAAVVRRHAPRAGGDGKLRFRPRPAPQLRLLPGGMDQ